jgi:hypothetical protein
MTCNQYKPNISVFICDTDSIKDNKIHEGDPNEAEHRLNWETYTPSVATYKCKIHKVKIEIISEKVSFKLWSRSSCINGIC